MDHQIAIRPLTADDYDRVAALWGAAGLHIRPVGRDSRAGFTEQIASGCMTIIGLEIAGALAGVVLVTHDSRRGWINRLAVHPDYRRQGLGLRLIAEAERALKARGLTVLAAHIEGWNEGSIALFERAGYLAMDGIIYYSKRERQDV